MSIAKDNIKALFANKKSKNVIIFTTVMVVVVVSISLGVVGSNKNGPPVPPSNVGATVERVTMVQQRQEGEMDPAYKARFEEQNKVQADVAEVSGGSAMLRIADDIKPRNEIKSDGADLAMSRSPSSNQAPAPTGQRGGGGGSGEKPQINPAVMALIAGMRPVSHQAHAELVGLAEVPAPGADEKEGGKGAPGNTKKEIGEVFYNAGDIVAATFTNTMNSNNPGVALATVQSGKLIGSKLIGSYVSAKGGIGIIAVYDKLSTPDGKLYKIQAKALNEQELSEMLATSIDRKYLNRFVVRPLAYFMKGMSQAIQTSLTPSNTTYNDASRITTINQTKATTGEQLKMATGMVGDAIIKELERPENITPTTIVNKNEVFALVFLDRVAQNSEI